MKDKQETKENQQKIAAPLEELSRVSGYMNIDELKGIFASVKELAKGTGFDELSAYKDILSPVKDAESLASLPIQSSKGNNGEMNKDR